MGPGGAVAVDRVAHKDFASCFGFVLLAVVADQLAHAAGTRISILSDQRVPLHALPLPRQRHRLVTAALFRFGPERCVKVAKHLL